MNTGNAQISAQGVQLIREAERLAEAGQTREAIGCYQEVLQRFPALADCWYNLGRLQRRADEFEAALASYARAIECGLQAPEEAHLNRAVIFTDDLRQDAAAERELKSALASNPDYLPAWLNLANLQEDLGRRDEARQSYEEILRRKPLAFEALARYAQLFDFRSPQDPLIGRLRAAAEHPAAGPAARASLEFALARALDASGAYAEAFRAAERANGYSRISVSPPAQYDRATHERLVDELIRAFPVGQALPPAGADAPPQPIFICGLFRSGSTLTEHLLAGHPQVAAGGELDLLPQLVRQNLTPFPRSVCMVSDATLARLAGQYREALLRRFPHAALVTDKRPDNFLYLGLIKRLFPRARIIHTTREPLDVCLSIFFLHLDQRIAYALDLKDIAHYLRHYRRLMAHWRRLYCEDILDFSYDSLVREPRPAVQRLLAFCGLDWNEACVDFAHRPASIKTASVWQVREALYQRASGRARHYASQLAGLAAELEPSGEP